MTKKQFDELIKALKGIETALYALRVPNTVYVSAPPIQPNTAPYTPYTNPTIICANEPK